MGVSLSGCVVTSSSGDAFAAPGTDCEIHLRVSGGVDAEVDGTDGCSHGSSLIAADDEPAVMQRDIGFLLPDEAPFEMVVIEWTQAFANEGTAAPARLVLRVGDADWTTPAGACLTDYTSEPCTTSDDQPGRKLDVWRVRCTAAAEREGAAPITIDDLSATSHCVDAAFFRELNDAGF